MSVLCAERKKTAHERKNTASHNYKLTKNKSPKASSCGYKYYTCTKCSATTKTKYYATKLTVSGITYTTSGKDLKKGEVKVTGCSKSITKLKIPKTVKYNGKTYKVAIIKSKAFQGSKIKTVVIKANIRIIYSKAFAKCKKLKTVTFVQTKNPEDLKYPCFLKPTISVTSSKKIMRKCECEADMREILDVQAVRHPDLSVMVEDYLNIEREYALLGLCVEDQVLIPDGIVEMLESGHAGRHGVTMVGQVIDTAPMQDLIDQIKAFMKTLHFTGLFDVDLLEADGKIYFCELNLRFGASGYAITASGVNLPAIFARYMLEHKAINTNAKLKKHGLTFVSEKVLIEDYAEHFITKKRLDQIMRNVDIHMVYNKNDPQPYLYFKQFYSAVWTMPILNAARKVKRTIKRSIRSVFRLKRILLHRNMDTENVDAENVDAENVDAETMDVENLDEESMDEE